MAQPIWEPTPSDVHAAQITRFTRFAEQRHHLTLPTYGDLHRWSVENLGDFWQTVWDHFDVHSTTPPGPALTTSAMPGATWFAGSQLNYAEHLLRQGDPDSVAIIDAAELGGRTSTLTWRELRRQVAALARTLRSNGIGPGDRVVGYLPNTAEAVVAFLATAALGATWASCGQDYAVPAAHARLGQLEPAALITADGYRFNGHVRDRADAAAELRSLLPTVRLAIAVDRVGAGVAGMTAWSDATDGEYPLEPLPVPFDHPLWVVFSSGTTGVPKGIVHGHGGVLLEQLKITALHFDLGERDTFFWFTTPSWMMWNSLVGGLLVGATIVCYDGSPAFPAVDALWDMADRFGVTLLGTSPGYLLGCMKDSPSDLRGPRALDVLRGVGVTGAALPASTAEWLVHQLGPRVRIASTSGGTDVVTGFVGSAPTLAVWAGEISGPCLAVAVDAFDPGGHSVTGDVGELVITEPMPSMPIRFWNDPDGDRYREAYYSMYPGVWRQGDWITITDRGSVVIHGRSDSTLNRHGVRMGSADIYDAVEQLPEIQEALVLGVEDSDGGYWMPLFVVLVPGIDLDDELRHRIVDTIRASASPRHVPDDIITAPGVPHTRTGKKLEIPLKRLMQGASPAAVVDPATVDAPELIDWYVQLAAARTAPDNPHQDATAARSTTPA
ncbi:acetoacetate--CoA ligase [Rhodococcus jostii]|uniref:acetoacetate--CoA ligase n=1 Tax=Rhodococcus jostii TaxID=132919 RepID=UPI0036452633